MRKFMDSIIGNTALKERICSDIISGNFSHAYIIEGVRGSGKHTLAKLTAAALSCQRKNDSDSPFPCMECPSCHKILNNLSPDVITVGCEGKATISVDNIRFIKEDVHIIPNELESKIYIIEDADKMTVQAQNALLLTLEEPPKYVGFILLCENAGMLLETIRSRAPVLRTEPISKEDIDRYICKVDRRATQMKETARDDYEELLMASENGIGKALEFLDPKVFSPVLEERKLTKDFLRAAVNHVSHAESLSFTSRFSQKRDIFASELSQIQLALRDLILIKKSENAPLYFYSSRQEAIELCELASINKLVNYSQVVSIATERISRNANVRLTVMSLLSDASMI